MEVRGMIEEVVNDALDGLVDGHALMDELQAAELVAADLGKYQDIGFQFEAGKAAGINQAAKILARMMKEGK